MKKTKEERLKSRRMRDRRRRAAKACPRCGVMAPVTNEVYGGDGRERTGWEWHCPGCSYHWHEYENGEGKMVRECLDEKAKRWKRTK